MKYEEIQALESAETQSVTNLSDPDSLPEGIYFVKLIEERFLDGNKLVRIMASPTYPVTEANLYDVGLENLQAGLRLSDGGLRNSMRQGFVFKCHLRLEHYTFYGEDRYRKIWTRIGTSIYDNNGHIIVK